MIESTQKQFEAAFRQYQEDPESRLSGPFIHSAPSGNIFSGPFKEYAWMLGKDTVLKKVWTPVRGWLFFMNDATTGGGPCST